MKNISDSVHQRILNKARQTKRPFNELLQYYTMERFLYRLSQSTYADAFILKGAFMLRAWDFPFNRPTKDLDFLGKFKNNPQNVIPMISEICRTEVAPDGIVFDAQNITFEEIIPEAEYVGLRTMVRGSLGNARVSVQLDIGFGETIIPGPYRRTILTILDMPTPELLCYTLESTIAEKFLAMVKRDVLNSRMKDFYDIWMLSRKNKFNFQTLRKAVVNTFENNGIEIDTNPTAFTEKFRKRQDKSNQWKAFINKNRIEEAPGSFKLAAKAAADFLTPIIKEESDPDTTALTWNPSKGWMPKE